MKLIPSINIGISGWSYKEWKNVFYPEGLKPAEWLNYYAASFSITEVNSSFYHLPKTTTTEKWKQATPPGFVFCPKMSRYLTHIKRLSEPVETMERFFAAMAPLKRKIGPVLVQLPASVHFDAGTATAFYSLCKKNYAYYHFALEARHDSWFCDESIGLMKQYNIAFVISQAKALPYAEFVTAKHIYVRFHGPATLFASGYSDEQLSYYAVLFRQWKDKGHCVWAFFNNTMGMHAIKNVATLTKLCNASQ
ncbi:MAG: DUF72 domain-containing protein [Chitinophagaceae bacterium]